MSATAHSIRPAHVRHACTAALALAMWCAGAPPRAEGDFARMESLAGERYGAPAAGAVQAWRDAVLGTKPLPELARLERINGFFNQRVAFGTDEEIWGSRDYWATPLETLGRARGDCEDFSIAKYATLRLVDIADEKLRLVYVKARIGGPQSRVTQAHMVVAYYAAPDAVPLILDNLFPEVVPASSRPDLTPVFSFNSAGIWVGSAVQATDKKPERRLSHWASVVKRMHDEGLR